MIYWERHNPRFSVTLLNPRVLGYDVWDWQGRPPGWIDERDTDREELDFSSPFSTAVLSHELRNRLRMGCHPGADFRHPHQLVNYYYLDEGVCLSLVGATEGSLLQGLNTQAPDWWSVEEGMTPLMRLQERIQVFVETVTQWYRASGNNFRHPILLETTVSGYCSRCGLPWDRHVAHTVPGFEGTSITFTNPEAARPYVVAFKKHYGGALRLMSEAELLEMPLPPNKRNLRVLLLEVKSRIDHPILPRSATDRLLEGGLLDE